MRRRRSARWYLLAAWWQLEDLYLRLALLANPRRRQAMRDVEALILDEAQSLRAIFGDQATSDPPPTPQPR